MAGRRRRHRRKNPGLAKYIILFLFGALLLGGVAAKYVRENGGRNIFAAKEFYFTSNLLTTDGAEYRLNSDATSVSFTLGNNADKLRFAEDDIAYEVRVNNGATVDKTTGMLANGKVSQDTITISGLEKGKVYEVKAIGRAGYQKTLKATFTIADNDENLYMHVDNSNRAYVLLTVWTNNLNGNVSITFPDGLIPDNTDPIMRKVQEFENGSYTSGTFTDTTNFNNTYSSYTYRFFKTSNSYGSFTVTLSDHVASPAEPK